MEAFFLPGPNCSFGRHMQLLQFRLWKCSQFPHCLAPIPHSISKAPTSWSVGDFSFATPGSCSQAAYSVKAFSSKEQPAAVPRTQSGCFLAGSLHWDTSWEQLPPASQRLRTATTLPFLAQTWSREAKESFLAYCGVG